MHAFDERYETIEIPCRTMIHNLDQQVQLSALIPSTHYTVMWFYFVAYSNIEKHADSTT